MAIAICSASPAAAADREGARTALASALKSYSGGDVHGTRKLLLAAVEKDPSYGFARIFLARTYLRLHNGVTAEQELKRAISAGYPAADTRHLMGHALFLQGKLREAFVQVTSADVPERYATYAKRIRGRIHVAARELPQARDTFNAALQTGPYSAFLWADIARFRYVAGDLASAIEATQRALELDARNSEALVLAGEMARNQYGLVAAIPWFERAIEFDPDSVNAMLELAATLGEAGRAVDMLAMTRKVLAIDARNPQAFYLQAVLAARAGKYDLSRALLYRTGEKLDTLPSVILLRAILDVQASNDEQAIFQLKKLVRMQPANLKARRLLGAAFSRSENYQAAIDVLRPIAMRADADSYTLTLVGRAYEQLDQREEAAWFLDRAGRPDRGEATPFEIPTSLSILARANAENPNNADAAVPYITQLVANGQAEAALAEAQRLQRLNQGAPAAHILVGDSLMALGRHGEAVAAYRNAANIRFSEGTALRLVKALNRINQQEEALRVLDLYLGQNPRSVPAMLLASEYFMASAQWDKASSMLEKLHARVGGRDATILNNLAWTYLGKGENARAIAYARAAYAITPASAAVSNTYGWTLFSTGFDKKAGLALLEKAVAKAPAHPGLQFRLGQAYAETGRKAEARRAIQAAMESKDFAGRDAAAKVLATL